jgi:hypothetical protein
MFTRPIKADIDRALSVVMHAARHRLMIEKNRIMAEALMKGALNGNRVIVTIASVADQIHDAAMKEATPVLLDFIGRLKEPPAEITSWARPHLEDLGNSLLDAILPNGAPADHQRIVGPYRAAFQQRLDGALRDVEIGFAEGAGFARAEQVESKDEWIAAAEAVRLLKPVFGGEHAAQQTICKRAHSGLIRARADRFMVGDVSRNATEVPKDLWWAEGDSALTQNWITGDFDTWLKRGEVHLRAFGVSFLLADIEQMIPAGTPAPAPATAAGGLVGRPPGRRVLSILSRRPETQDSGRRCPGHARMDHSAGLRRR